MAETRPAPEPTRWIDAQPGEWAAFGWSFLYFFALLTGYYVMRPVRDAMGAVGELRWLFTATLVCMVLLTPVYGALVARLPRRVFLPVVYGFFIACLVAFYFAFDHDWPWRGPVFFVWVAVFNLFAVSVFWSYMADVFEEPQARRLYGAIAAGGTLGGFLGPILTARFVEQVGVANLLLVTAASLAVCLGCIVALAPHARARERRRREASGDQAMGGSVLAGLKLVRDHPLLQAFCVLMVFGVGVGTLLYNEQAAIARAGFPDDAARTAFYARIDLAINVLTIVVQVGVTRWLLVRYGVAPAMLIPAAAITLGYCALAASPFPLLVAIVQVVTRSGEFALAKPARESIYTRVDREIRYKAKGFIDTAVYRTGDVAFVWLHHGLTKVLGLGSAVVFGVGIFVALGLLGGVLWLLRLLPGRDDATSQEPGRT